jgi:hypothetical protein
MDMEELRKHYDETDTAPDLEAAIQAGAGNWDTETQDDPLIGTSLRLPRSILRRVRQEAGERHLATTALIRVLVVEGLDRPAETDSSSYERIFEAIQSLEKQMEEIRKAVSQLAPSQSPKKLGSGSVTEVDFAGRSVEPRKAAVKRTATRKSGARPQRVSTGSAEPVRTAAHGVNRDGRIQPAATAGGALVVRRPTAKTAAKVATNVVAKSATKAVAKSATKSAAKAASSKSSTTSASKGGSTKSASGSTRRGGSN